MATPEDVRQAALRGETVTAPANRIPARGLNQREDGTFQAGARPLTCTACGGNAFDDRNAWFGHGFSALSCVHLICRGCGFVLTFAN